MEYRQQILALAEHHPLLPQAVAKALNTDSIMAGAMLSELRGKGLLNVSTIKIGGSPLYYLPGKETQLLNHLGALNEKDRKTLELLKQERVLGETGIDPLTRVSLNAIKDFAKPLIVQYNGKQETFWKWFELTDKDAEDAIRQKIQPKEQPTIARKETEQPTDKPQQTAAPEEPKAPPQASQKQKPASTDTSDFWADIERFFAASNMKLVEKTTVKKGREFDLTLTIPSPVGALTYYCKAYNKKRISDADLSNAYVQGQLKKLPVLFLTKGQLTKKAKEILPKLTGITVKQL